MICSKTDLSPPIFDIFGQFSVLLSLLLVVTLVGGILALVYRSNLDQGVLKVMQETKDKYGTSDLATQTWDDMQQKVSTG